VLLFFPYSLPAFSWLSPPKRDFLIFFTHLCITKANPFNPPYLGDSLARAALFVLLTPYFIANCFESFLLPPPFFSLLRLLLVFSSFAHLTEPVIFPLPDLGRTCSWRSFEFSLSFFSIKFCYTMHVFWNRSASRNRFVFSSCFAVFCFPSTFIFCLFECDLQDKKFLELHTLFHLSYLNTLRLTVVLVCSTPIS